MLNGLGLCAGIGGAELALSEWVRFVCLVEWEDYPQEVLRIRHPGVPIWDDLRKFDGKPWRGLVDFVAAGFPCQDISLAGSRKGLEGERSALFFDVVRVVKEIRPGFVFLENVPGIRAYLETVEWEMADAGYECRWDVVSAAEVGAWHLRKRWFLLAADARGRRRDREKERKVELKGRAEVVGGCDADGNPDNKGETARQVHPATHTNGAGGSGWPSEPDVGRVVHGLSSRMDRRLRAERIKALGNCMVPAQAREAFRRLSGLNLRGKP